MTHSLLSNIIINDGTAEAVMFLQFVKVDEKTIPSIYYYHDLWLEKAISTVFINTIILLK